MEKRQTPNTLLVAFRRCLICMRGTTRSRDQYCLTSDTASGPHTMAWGLCLLLFALISVKTVLSDNCERNIVPRPIVKTVDELLQTFLDSPNHHSRLIPDSCGRRKVSSIINGQTAKDSNWPWIVFVESETYGVCGGTIVSAYWILTAAHCHTNTRPISTIRAGATDLSSWGSRVQVRHVDTVVVHPRSKVDDIVLKVDIALVKLTQPLTFTSSVQPACFMDGHRVPSVNTQDCYILGWGRTGYTPGQSFTNKLQQQATTLLSAQQCQQVLELMHFSNRIRSWRVCSSTRLPRTGLCNGDSGSPFVCRGNTGHLKDTYIVVGVANYGMDKCNKNRPIPNVHTNVTKYMDWVLDTITGYHA